VSVEIERKFLVKDHSWKQSVVRSTRIKQGYLCTDSGRTVRVRTRDDEAWLTVKGARKGISRAEFEYTIPMSDALEMLEMSVGTVVDKVRHEVSHAGRMWEVDVFEGPNAPLIVAELEFEDESDVFEHPAWLGEDVSEDASYSNSALAHKPYSHW
jgi:adenylate cyclase